MSDLVPRKDIQPNGMQLSREYFITTARPLLERDFPELYPRLAAGLAGNGSECFGYDDEISRDHDWGVDFYIWTPEEDKDKLPALRKWKDALIAKNPPEHARTRTEYGARIGAMTSAEFYTGLIGTPGAPQTLNEWIRAPEENFAMTVNGEIFIDGPGEFTKTRRALLDYYPEDIRLKKISAKCMALAQTGQYNHERTARRGDSVTLRTVLSRFNDAAIAMAFLLNKTYRPYYKWAWTALRELPAPGAETAALLLKIAETGGLDDKSQSKRQSSIEELCALFIKEMKNQGLTNSDDTFMAPHGEQVRSNIKTDFLRNLPPQYEI